MGSVVQRSSLEQKGGREWAGKSEIRVGGGMEGRRDQDRWQRQGDPEGRGETGMTGKSLAIKDKKLQRHKTGTENRNLTVARQVRSS